MYIELNGLKIKDRKTLHMELKEKLGLPEQYGENLDDLWDCLTGWVKLPMNLTWNNHEESKDGLDEYFDKVCNLFDEFAQEEDSFTFELS